MSIRYFTNKEIDKHKWDNCISNASNGLIYGYSFYLDIMAKNWDAIILNDYEAVLPLTWNKKYTFYYLYQPFFMASLGVFGNNLSAIIVNEFLLSIPKKFKYWDFYLNHSNRFTLTDFTLYERMNYVLDLNNSYDNLFSRFRENIKRNIKKTEKLNCVVKKDIPVEEVIELAK
ncbi:MAG: hypothetical protein HY305_02995, partial [Sphingobacteriales bacterium]|nr:hypothetical protein [Sphingobacteriales bacterium]